MSELTTEEKHALEFLQRLYDIEKGRVPIKSKLAPLTDPENLQAMSILSPTQVKFVVDAFWFAETWRIFKGMKGYAVHLMKTSPSKLGTGREQVIRYAGAIVESKVLSKLGLTVKGSESNE